MFVFRFLHELVTPGPVSIPVGLFRIFTKIRGDTRHFVFIAGVNDTGDELFTGVNDTGDKLSPVSLLPEINYRR
jgi:hypothetical protein